MKKKIVLLGAMVIALCALVYITQPETVYAEELEDCSSIEKCPMSDNERLGDGWLYGGGPLCCTARKADGKYPKAYVPPPPS